MTDAKPKASKTAKKSTAKGEPPRFDASLGRLEEIVAELEQGGLGLEASLEQYKEGVALLKGCREQLAGFRAQVEELTSDGVRAHDHDPDHGVNQEADQGAGQGADRPAGSGPGGPASVSELDTPF